MARIRTIKPDFWSDGTMVGLSPWARLFYIGTWNFSLCDRGHLPDDALGLKLKILPADAVDADALLAELVTTGRLIRRRSNDGRIYLFNPRLAEHQKTDPRWKSRCPHCASEEAGGYVEEAVNLPEPQPNSPESRRASPEPAEPLQNSAMGSKGKEGIVKEQLATLAAAPASGAAPTTVTQRSKRITDAYAVVEPMCRWPAVNAVVIKAIKTERWTDPEIHDALLRLADEGRSVTVDTLRIELDGLAPRASPNGARASPGDQRMDAALAAGQRAQARLDANTRKEIEPP